jgi:hypothetical protein
MKRPERTRHDWETAKFQNCHCGAWARVADGQCAACHDADYQDSIEAYYVDQITDLKAQLAASERAREEQYIECAEILHDKSAKISLLNRDIEAAELHTAAMVETLIESIGRLDKWDMTNEHWECYVMDKDKDGEFFLIEDVYNLLSAIPARVKALGEVVEAAKVLKDFALTAPGRLPFAVSDAIDKVKALAALDQKEKP